MKEQLSEYSLIIKKPNQSAIIRLRTYESKYIPPTRWDIVKDVLLQLGGYVVIGVLYLAYILCISIGVGLMLSNIASL
jgi:hypothetical protein